MRINDFTEDWAHKTGPSQKWLTWERTRNKSVLLGLGFLDQRFLADHDDDARIGNVEPPLVRFRVVANLGAFRQRDVAVDDGPADSAVAAHVHVVVEDRLGDLAVAVHPHI